MIRRAMSLAAAGAIALVGFAGVAGAEPLNAADTVAKLSHARPAPAAIAPEPVPVLYRAAPAPAAIGAGAEAFGETMLAKGRALNTAVHQ